MLEESVLESPAELEVPALESTESTESTETEAAEPGTEAQTTETTETDAKAPLWKQAKPALEKIQAENPGLAAKIKDALFRDQQLTKDLPEGIKGAVALRTEVASLASALNDPQYQGAAPAKILADVKSQLGYFHELDGLFTSGSPDFAAKLADASPESFQKLAPTIFAKFAETNPDGYSSYVSQAVVGHMNAQDVPMQFKLLGLMLPRLPESPEKQEVIGAIEKVYAWTEALKGLAAKPVDAPAKKEDTAAQLETQRQELAQQQLDVTRQSWNSSHTKFGYDLITSETARIAGKTALTDQQKTSIRAKVAEEVNARLEAKKEYGTAMRTFLQNKDQEGYRRRLHSEYKNLVPGATARAYADVVASGKTTAVAKTPVKAAATTMTTAATSSNGFRPISKYPVGQVDMRRTSGKDLEAGRLTLKDGSKVMFKRANAV